MTRVLVPVDAVMDQTVDVSGTSFRCKVIWFALSSAVVMCALGQCGVSREVFIPYAHLKAHGK